MHPQIHAEEISCGSLGLGPTSYEDDLLNGMNIDDPCLKEVKQTFIKRDLMQLITSKVNLEKLSEEAELNLTSEVLNTFYNQIICTEETSTYGYRGDSFPICTYNQYYSETIDYGWFCAPPGDPGRGVHNANETGIAQADEYYEDDFILIDLQAIPACSDPNGLLFNTLSMLYTRSNFGLEVVKAIYMCYGADENLDLIENAITLEPNDPTRIEILYRVMEDIFRFSESNCPLDGSLPPSLGNNPNSLPVNSSSTNTALQNNPCEDVESSCSFPYLGAEYRPSENTIYYAATVSGACMNTSQLYYLVVDNQQLQSLNFTAPDRDVTGNISTETLPSIPNSLTFQVQNESGESLCQQSISVTIPTEQEPSENKIFVVGNAGCCSELPESENCEKETLPQEDNPVYQQYNACFNCIGQGGIWTAIGCLDTTPIGILTALIRIAFGVMGGVALVQLIMVGLMYQSGQESKVMEAREKFKATIAGIALLVFSVLILRIIGINVLDVIPVGSV